MRVLVIDKHANGQLLRTMLLSIGASDVVLIENSESALESLQAEHYDLVFCDEIANPLNPVAFARKLRRDPHTKNVEIPLILTAAAATARHVELARDSGANDFLVRPINAAVLKRKVTAALLNPNGFVSAEEFKGPDRRRRVVEDPSRGERRGNSTSPENHTEKAAD